MKKHPQMNDENNLDAILSAIDAEIYECKVNALIKILIEKKIITPKEFNEVFIKLYKSK